MIKLLLKHPFFATLLMRLDIKACQTTETGYTNGKVIGYNPKWIDELTLEQTIGFLVHEAEHLVLLHDIRRQHREHKKWNYAADYAINPMCIDWGFQLPPNGLIDDAFDGMSADEIYGKLPDEQGGGKGGGGKGQGDEPGWGEVRDQPGQDGNKAGTSEKKQQEQQRKMDVEQAKQTAKAAGKMPAGLERLIDDILTPKLDWRIVLRRFINTFAKNDYTWYPPSRRFIHMGLYLPSLRSNEIENIILAIDTSGSISKKELSQFAGEVNAILEEVNTTIDVLYCDTEIPENGGHEVFEKFDLPLKLKAVGGGGTDFRPPFEWVAEHGKFPNCFIYLTDMWCHDFPEVPPPYPVLWIRTSDFDNEPPFGQVLDLNMAEI